MAGAAPRPPRRKTRDDLVVAAFGCYVPPPHDAEVACDQSIADSEIRFTSERRIIRVIELLEASTIDGYSEELESALERLRSDFRRCAMAMNGGIPAVLELCGHPVAAYVWTGNHNLRGSGAPEPQRIRTYLRSVLALCGQSQESELDVSPLMVPGRWYDAAYSLIQLQYEAVRSKTMAMPAAFMRSHRNSFHKVLPGRRLTKRLLHTVKEPTMQNMLPSATEILVMDLIPRLCHLVQGIEPTLAANLIPEMLSCGVRAKHSPISTEGAVENQRLVASLNFFPGSRAVLNHMLGEGVFDDVPDYGVGGEKLANLERSVLSGIKGRLENFASVNVWCGEIRKARVQAYTSKRNGESTLSVPSNLHGWMAAWQHNMDALDHYGDVSTYTTNVGSFQAIQEADPVGAYGVRLGLLTWLPRAELGFDCDAFVNKYKMDGPSTNVKQMRAILDGLRSTVLDTEGLIESLMNDIASVLSEDDDDADIKEGKRDYAANLSHVVTSDIACRNDAWVCGVSAPDRTTKAHYEGILQASLLLHAAWVRHRLDKTDAYTKVLKLFVSEEYVDGLGKWNQGQLTDLDHMSAFLKQTSLMEKVKPTDPILTQCLAWTEADNEAMAAYRKLQALKHGVHMNREFRNYFEGILRDSAKKYDLLLDISSCSGDTEFQIRAWKASRDQCAKLWRLKRDVQPPGGKDATPKKGKKDRAPKPKDQKQKKWDGRRQRLRDWTKAHRLLGAPAPPLPSESALLRLVGTPESSAARRAEEARVVGVVLLGDIARELGVWYERASRELAAHQLEHLSATPVSAIHGDLDMVASVAAASVSLLSTVSRAMTSHEFDPNYEAEVLEGMLQELHKADAQPQRTVPMALPIGLELLEHELIACIDFVTRVRGDASSFPCAEILRSPEPHADAAEALASASDFPAVLKYVESCTSRNLERAHARHVRRDSVPLDYESELWEEEAAPGEESAPDPLEELAETLHGVALAIGTMVLESKGQPPPSDRMANVARILDASDAVLMQSCRSSVCDGVIHHQVSELLSKSGLSEGEDHHGASFLRAVHHEADATLQLWESGVGSYSSRGTETLRALRDGMPAMERGWVSRFSANCERVAERILHTAEADFMQSDQGAGHETALRLLREGASVVRGGAMDSSWCVVGDAASEPLSALADAWSRFCGAVRVSLKGTASHADDDRDRRSMIRCAEALSAMCQADGGAFEDSRVQRLCGKAIHGIVMDVVDAAGHDVERRPEEPVDDVSLPRVRRTSLGPRCAHQEARWLHTTIAVGREGHERLRLVAVAKELEAVEVTDTSDESDAFGEFVGVTLGEGQEQEIDIDALLADINVGTGTAATDAADELSAELAELLPVEDLGCTPADLKEYEAAMRDIDAELLQFEHLL